MTARAKGDRTVSMTVYQSEMGYGKRCYVEVNIQIRPRVVRKSGFRMVFPRETIKRGIGTSQRAKAKGVIPLSSCVESVVKNKGERYKSKRSCRNCLPFERTVACAALSRPFPRCPSSNEILSFHSSQPNIQSLSS